MWITQSIKRSSSHKNKLYKKWVCTRDPLDEKEYKNYLKVFKRVSLAAHWSVDLIEGLNCWNML